MDLRFASALTRIVAFLHLHVGEPVSNGRPSPGGVDVNNLTRIEAYSDAVFAIAATLLILEIRVPPVDVHAPLNELWHALAGLWPSYLAFVLSFVVILIAWVNHHHGIHMMTKTSTPFLYANGLLLLVITFMPFPTALLATYIMTGLAPVVVVFYAGSGLLCNVAFRVWFAATQRPVYLLKPDIGKERIKKIWAQMTVGTLGYAAAALIGWWLPLIGLGIFVALTVLWIVMSTQHRPEREDVAVAISVEPT